MSEIEFENEKAYTDLSYKSRSILGEPRTPTMVKAVMRLFRFRDERGAGIFLLSMAVFCALLSIILNFKLFYRSGEVILNENLPENIKAALPKINE